MRSFLFQEKIKQEKTKNKLIQRKDPIVLYFGTNNRYMMDYFCEVCGILTKKFREEVVERSTNFNDKNMIVSSVMFLVKQTFI